MRKLPERHKIIERACAADDGAISAGNFFSHQVEKKGLPITAVWLRNDGTKIRLLVEVDGKWFVACEESPEGPFSHIAEARGFFKWPLDPVTGKEDPARG